jgi:hypothetical protein
VVVVFKIKSIQFILPELITISSNDLKKLNSLEDGKHGRQIFTKTIKEDPLAYNTQIVNNIRKNIDNKKFGSNAKSVISKKGFDKYGVETKETYNSLKIKINYKQYNK